MTSRRSRYPYRRLEVGQARLLELDMTRDALTGKIYTFVIPDSSSQSRSSHSVSSLEEISGTFQYYALSHHWEPKPKDPKDERTIALRYNGDKLFDLTIRPSLYELLREFQSKVKLDSGMAKYIWIDAICIDQDDEADKKLQLPRMGSIYNGAVSVIVWLGASTDESMQAIKFIDKLQEEQELRKCLRDASTAKDWMAFAMVTRKPWFTRCWIVQEIAAAREATVWLGNNTIDWEDFASALSLFGSEYEKVRYMLRKAGEFAVNRDWLGEIAMSGAYMLIEAKDLLLRKRSDCRVTEHNLTLEALLTTLACFHVSQAHNVVYSILWLSSDANTQRKHSILRNRSPTRELTEAIAKSRSPDVSPPSDYDDSRGRAPTSSDHLSGAIQNATLVESVHVSGTRSPSHVRAPRRFSNLLELPATEIEKNFEEIELEQATGTGITIDYNMSVFDLVKQVFQHVVGLTGSVDLMCFVWAPLPRKNEEPHPTWLLSTQRDRYPDKDSELDGGHYEITRRSAADPFVGKPGTGLRPYHASGHIKARDYVSIEGRVLHMAGYRIAKIAEFEDTALNAVVPEGWLSRLGWERGCEPPDVLWCLLVGNKGANGISEPPRRFRLACKWALDALNPGENLDLRGQRDDGKREKVFTEFVQRAISVTWNRRLFFARSCNVAEGADAVFVGLGPQQARKGDYICIPFGCSVPVLLRSRKAARATGVTEKHIFNTVSHSTVNFHRRLPSVTLNDDPASLMNGNSSDTHSPNNTDQSGMSGDPEHFTFVGECFVHNFMSGEVFNHVEENGVKAAHDFYIH